MIAEYQAVQRRREDTYLAREMSLEHEPYWGACSTRKYTVYSTITKRETNHCPVCLELPDHPVNYCQREDRHILCRKCFEQLPPARRMECIFCRDPSKISSGATSSINIKLQDILNNGEFFCPAGCDKTFPGEKLQDHFRSCRPFECARCMFNGAADEMEEHEKECKPPLETCCYCNQDYSIQDRKIHKTECQEFPVEVEFPDGKKRTVPRKVQSSVELVSALKAGKRPLLNVDLSESGQEKKIRQCKLTELSYRMLEQGLTTVMDYVSEQKGEAVLKKDVPAAEPAKPAAVSPVLDGLLALFSDVLGENYKIIRRSKILSKFQMRCLVSGDRKCIFDDRNIEVLHPSLRTGVKTPYTVSNIRIKLLGDLQHDKAHEWTIHVDPSNVQERFRGFVKLSYRIIQNYLDYYEFDIDIPQFKALSIRNTGELTVPYTVRLEQFIPLTTVEKIIRWIRSNQNEGIKVEIKQVFEVPN